MGDKNIRVKLRKIVDDNTTKKGRVFDYIVQVLIFGSLIGYAIETLPNNSETTTIILKWIENIATLIFSIEYVLRIFVAKHPLKYIFSF